MFLFGSRLLLKQAEYGPRAKRSGAGQENKKEPRVGVQAEPCILPTAGPKLRRCILLLIPPDAPNPVAS